MSQNTIITILVIIAVVIFGIFLFNKTSQKISDETQEIVLKTTTPTTKVGKYDIAKEITTPDGFINTDGITIGENIGKKVTLIDFWTYSCINCQRTLPYINAWYEKYKDKGLEIIGIHTPEFQFEHKYENVKDAVDRFDIKFPVVLDNDFSTWRAYNNFYWPRKYLIDIDGYIVYNHIGEGAYENTEREIQKALDERMKRLQIEDAIPNTVSNPESVEVANPVTTKSPETYFGSLRNKTIGNGTTGKEGTQTFTLPENINSNTLYLEGEWNITPEFAESVSEDAKIVFRYEAEKVFLVARSDKETEIEIYRDDKLIKKEFVQKDRLYRLIEDTKSRGEHIINITIKKPGFQAFAFTFG